MTDSLYDFTNHNVSGAFLDTPNTTQVVYYTAWWNSRIGDGANNAANTVYINRVHTMNDGYRAAPSSSWTATEIWDSGTPYIPPSTDGTITIASGNVGIGITNPEHLLDIVSNNEFIAAFRSVSRTSAIGIGFDIIAAIGNAASQNIFIDSKNTGSIISRTNANERLVIDGNGNINIDRILQIAGVNNYNGGM